MSNQDHEPDCGVHASGPCGCTPAPAPSDEPTLCGEPWSATDCCVLPAGHGGRHRWSAERKFDHCDGCDSLTCGGWFPPDEVERRIAQARDEALEEACAVVARAAPPFGPAINRAIRALKSKP